MKLDADLAANFARIALGHVTREFPFKLEHAVAGPDDVRSPRELYPIFYGSFDWHSCVHGWWSLLTLMRLFPDIEEAPAIAALARAKIDPRPTAELFRQLGRDDGEDFTAVEFLNSHPASGDRATRFAAAYRSGTGYSPVISAADYKAMRTACPAKHDAEREQEEAD